MGKVSTYMHILRGLWCSLELRGRTVQPPVKGSGVAYVVLEEPEKDNLGVRVMAYGDCTLSSMPCIQ